MIADLALWFLIGGGVGLLNMLLLVCTVRFVKPGLRAGSAGLMVGGYLLRYVLTGVALAVAVPQGLRSILAVGLGLWVARWFGVFLGQSGRIDWTHLRMGLR